MNQIDQQARAELPSDIATIGAEFSRAIHAQHRRHAARRSRAQRAAVGLLVLGVGSGTALAAELAVQPGHFLNPCLARAVATPQGTYTSLQQLDQACGQPYTPPIATPPPPLPQTLSAPDAQGPTAGQLALPQPQRPWARTATARRYQRVRQRTNALAHVRHRPASRRRPLGRRASATEK